MLGSNIGRYRRQLGLTQEQLAQKLDVTNQAVSKWETDQCCPDTMLLPKLADILGVSIDTLFDRETAQPGEEAPKPALPWADDGAFHVVLFHGHTLVGSEGIDGDLTFTYEGPAKDVYCSLNLQCGDVGGNVSADGYVECGDVDGDVAAADYVECGDVGGSVNAMRYVECGDVGGGVNASHHVECGDVGGNVTAGAHVDCGDVGGSVSGNNGDTGFHFDPFKK